MGLAGGPLRSLPPPPSPSRRPPDPLVLPQRSRVPPLPNRPRATTAERPREGDRAAPHHLTAAAAGAAATVLGPRGRCARGASRISPTLPEAWGNGGGPPGSALLSNLSTWPLCHHSTRGGSGGSRGWGGGELCGGLAERGSCNVPEATAAATGAPPTTRATRWRGAATGREAGRARCGEGKTRWGRRGEIHQRELAWGGPCVGRRRPVKQRTPSVAVRHCYGGGARLPPLPPKPCKGMGRPDHADGRRGG